MRDLQDLFDRSARVAGTTVYWTTRTARLMIGLPDYETYVAHGRGTDARRRHGQYPVVISWRPDINGDLVSFRDPV